MTTRHCGYVVTLADDTREDDAEAIILALRMVKGVAAVRPIESDPSAEMVLTARITRNVEHAVQAALASALYPGTRC